MCHNVPVDESWGPNLERLWHPGRYIEQKGSDASWYMAW